MSKWSTEEQANSHIGNTDEMAIVIWYWNLYYTIFFFGIHFFLEEEQVNEADSHYWPIPGTTFKGFFCAIFCKRIFLHNVQAVDIIMLYCDSTSMYNALII